MVGKGRVLQADQKAPMIRALFRQSNSYPLALLVWLAFGAVLLPLLLLSAYGFNRWVANEQEAELSRVSGYSTTLARNLDRELKGFLETVDVLAGSRHLQLNDLETFAEIARDAAAKTGGGHFVLIDRALQERVNTNARPSTFPSKIVDPQAVQQVFDTGHPGVSNLYENADTKELHFWVLVPVLVNGTIRYVLSYAPRHETMSDILQQTFRPNEWFASIVDGSGRIVARSFRHDDFFGKFAAPDFIKTLSGNEGIIESIDLEGRSSITSYHSSAISGWKAIVWAPKSVLGEPMRNATWATAGLIILAISASIVTAWLMARAAAKPITKLVADATAMGRGEALNPSGSIIREASFIGQALADASQAIVKRESDIKESEARFRNMADTAPVMIWMSDAVGQCIYLSQYWYQLTGQTPETGLGLGWLDVIHHDDQSRCRQSFFKANHNQVPFKLEYRIKGEDGKYHWAIDSARPRMSTTGDFLGYIGSVIDISDRKLIEEAANEARKFAENLMNTVPVSIYIFNCETGASEQLNSHAREVLGYDTSTWHQIAKQISSLIHPEDLQRVQAHFEQLGVHGSDNPTEVEYRMQHADGSWRWFLSRDLVYERTSDGSIRKILGAATDITDRKLSEQRLQESEAQTRANAAEIEAIYNSVPLGIVLFDKDFRFVRINDRLARINGRPAMDHQGLKIEDVLPDATVKTLRSLQPRLLAGDVIEDQELIGEDPRTGDVLAWSISYRPLRDRTGEISHFLGSIADITSRKRAEDVLAQARASLELALEAADAVPWDYVVSSRQREWLLNHDEQIGDVPFGNVTPVESMISDVHPDDRSLLHSVLQQERLAEPGSRFTVQFRRFGPDRKLRWIERRSHVGANESGGRRVFGLNIDVTERENAEEALRQSEERFRLAATASRSLIYDVSLAEESKPIAFFGLENLTGNMNGEHRHSMEWWNSLIHPNDLARHASYIDHLMVAGGRFTSEYRMRHAEGHWIWVQDDGELLIGPTGPLRLAGTVSDITERKQREEQIRLLMREVSHRSKNMLAVIQVIARQTAASDSKDFVKRFGERVQSLSATQDLLVSNEWLGVELHDLVEAQLMQFKGLVGSRVVLKGKSIRISAASAQNLGLAIHELASNAGKYGALSNVKGKVTITWSVSKESNPEASFTIQWKERNGPPVLSPERRGFGSTVMGSMVKLGLSADVNIAYAKRGFEWTLSCPVSKVLEQARHERSSS